MHISMLSCMSLFSLSVILPTLALPTNGPNDKHDNEPLVRLLYEYPDGTWLENLAVRASGELLITHIEKPRLDQFNPLQANAEPEVVHTFHSSLALSGIAEIAPDSFAVAVGNFTFEGGGVRNSWGIWNVNLHKPGETKATVNEIASVPEAVFPDGMCILPTSSTPHNILFGDIRTGVIWHVDTTTGDSKVMINNTLTAFVKDPVFGASGVNGIHIQNGILYFVNTAQGLFVSQPINPNGTPAGDATIISQSQKPEDVFYFDDFAIKDGDAYLVTGSGNSIERMGLDGTPKGRIIAGNLNSTKIAGPTSAAFGRTKWDSHILYVITTGAIAAPVDGNITTGAQILAVDTSRWIC
jgi:hypothetical protein